MARPKKKTEKIWNFGNFSILVDIYRKKVAFCHIYLRLRNDFEDGFDMTDIKRSIRELLENTFNQRRCITDLTSNDTLQGKSSKIRMSVYLEMFECYEEYFIEKANEIVPKVERILNNNSIEIVKNDIEPTTVIQN